MKVICGIGNFPESNLRDKIVSIGVFDGVHRGHQKILQALARDARKSGQKSAVVTFADHPSLILYPPEKVPALTSLEHKLEFISQQGVDTCYVLYFNKHVADMPAEDFVREILIRRIGMAALYVGEDFCLGRKAGGNIAVLKKLSIMLGFRLRVFMHLKVKGRIVSSTLIRSLVAEGDLKLAEAFLGRRVSFLGRVVHGDGRGRILGYPTANILPYHEVLAPFGIYLSLARMGKREYKSLTYIGSKPTFQDDRALRSIEVFLFGEHRSLYGRKIEVSLLKKLRQDMKFPSKESLVKQMERDVLEAKSLFKKLS